MESFDMESQTVADLYFVKYLKKPTVRVKILSSVSQFIKRFFSQILKILGSKHNSVWVYLE